MKLSLTITIANMIACLCRMAGRTPVKHCLSILISAFCFLLSDFGRILVACIAFLPLAVNAGNVYYVDFFGGVDTQAGSVSAPWQHCPGDVYTNVYHALNPGDTVIFKGGVFYTNSITNWWSGTPGNPITYDGNSAGTFGTGAAILDGQNQPTPAAQTIIFCQGRQFITWTNLVIQNSGGVPDALNNTNAYSYPPNTLPVSTGHGAEIMDSSNIIIANCVFQRMSYWSNSLPNNPDVLQSGYGILAISDRDCLFISNAFTKINWIAVDITAAAWPAQTLVSSNITVSGCDFSHYLVWGISISPSGNNAVLSGITVSNCAIHDYPEMWAGNWTGGGGSSGAPHCDGIVGGISTAFTNGVCTNINIVANNFYWNATNGGGTAYVALFYGGGNWNIWNNVFRGGWNAEGCIYYQDASFPTNYLTPTVVNVFNNSSLTGMPLFWERWLGAGNGGYDPGLYTINVLNNAIYATNATQQSFNVLVQGTSNGPTRMDYNSYFNNTLWEYLDPGAIFQWVTNAGPFFTVPQLQALTNGYEAHGLYADPLFANISYAANFGSNSSLNNLHLQSGSAAIGAGTNLSSFFTTDKDGNARPASGNWTIGAYQTSGGTNFHGLFLKRP